MCMLQEEHFGNLGVQLQDSKNTQNCIIQAGHDVPIQIPGIWQYTLVRKPARRSGCNRTFHTFQPVCP